MTSNVPVCPGCGKTEAVEKASTLYLRGLERSEPGKPGPSQAERRLSQRLGPPSGRKESLTRPLHPDLQVLVYSLVAPVFLYGIWSSEPRMLLPVLGILAVGYAAYFGWRSRLVEKYQQREQQKTAEIERVQRRIARWMELYYCAQDEGVFKPGEDELVSLEELPRYLESAG